MSPGRQPAAVRRRRLTAEQEPFLVARALSATYSSGYILHPHTHASHQLLFASSGAMTVTGDRTSWMIPPGRAVLIRAGTPHAIRMWGEVAMRSLYFPVSAQPPAFQSKTCRVISVSPLLREVILRVADLAALDSRVESDAHVMSVLIDELDAADIEPLLLPLPGDARALKVAECVLKSPADPATATELARRCGLSARTLERVFRAETGMRFGLWRQKAKLRVGAPAGGACICHRRRARMRILERERLHLGIQADVRVYAGCDDRSLRLPVWVMIVVRLQEY